MSKLQFLYAQRHLPPYMASVHQDDKEAGIVTRLWDHPTPDHPVALLVLPVLPDYTEDVTLGPVGLQKHNVVVDFDCAEHDGRMWLRSDSEDEDWVAIEGPEHAITVAMRLLAWAKASQEKYDEDR